MSEVQGAGASAGPPKGAPRGDDSAGVLDRYLALERTGALADLERLRGENRELDMLLNDAAALFTLEDVDAMIDFVVGRLGERFMPHRLVVLVERPAGSAPTVRELLDLKPAEHPFPPAAYPPLLDFFRANPWTISYADLEARAPEVAALAALRDCAPELLVPLRGIAGPFGLVLAGRSLRDVPYGPAEAMYLDKLLRFLGISIQNGIHRESSITDFKTGLFNHRHFLARLEEEILRAARRPGAERRKAGLVMLDIDHFKRFNDTYGHLAGDEVLAGIARALRRVLRGEDVVARFGGEEFCVLLVDCDEDKLLEVAERVRRAVAEQELEWKGERLRVTASLGCCIVDPRKERDPALLIERADRALYESKRGGRDRTTLYRSGLLQRAAAFRR